MLNGVKINFDKSRAYIYLTLSPSEFSSELDIRQVRAELDTGETKRLFISESTLKSACETANHYFKTGDPTPIKERIGERRNAEIEFRIPEDGMSANLVITSPFGGKMPTVAMIKSLALKNNIKRGLGIKAIQKIILEAKASQPGTAVEGTVAKGLPARNGRSSRFIPLVPNALDRVLRPQSHDGERVDMRNLGEIICVKAHVPVLRRTEPSPGRTGFDIKGNLISPQSGSWVEFRMGNGTALAEDDQNVLVSTISGMPKYQDQVMNIDDTYICNGVNVGTGHVTYEGAVLVNGDVTEKMEIKAKGDVTINGFVESALIESGGDIIITEGAMGKVNETGGEFNCHLIAAGSIHVQHGQGIDIQCGGNITVGRQLAYSRLRCNGAVIVGQVDRPMGNLFACEIVCQERIEAGTLGAVSGSTLKIDFTPGFELLAERKDSLEELLTHLRENNIKHKQKIELLRCKKIPKELKAKVEDAFEMFNNESALLEWIENKVIEVTAGKEQYYNNAKLIANKRLYPGVSVKLNNRNWRSEREYEKAVIHYDSHQWLYEPLI